VNDLRRAVNLVQLTALVLVHGLCTDEAEQAETPIDNRATWTARLQQIQPIGGSSRTLQHGR